MLPQLISASYWTRAWTLQEFAHLSARILCLNAEFSSVVALSPDTSMLGERARLWAHHQLFEIDRLYKSFARDPGTLTILLDYIIWLKCSDPRDKVFSLRALFPSVLGGITVDYNRSVEDIFTDATRCLVLASQDLFILYISCSCRKSQKEPYNMPSWVIDWTSESKGGLLHTSHKTLPEEINWKDVRCHSHLYDLGIHRPASFSDDGLLLKLFGKSFSQVSTCVSDKLTYHPKKGPKKAAKNFEGVIYKFLKDATENQVPSQAPLGSAILKLLRSIRYDSSVEIGQTESQIEVENDVDRICFLMKEGSEINSEFMRRKRLFFTTEGRLGFGNSDLMPGDLICSFEGLRLPIIVREKVLYHELISPAVVVGATDQEMCPEDKNEFVLWEIT